MGGTYKIVSFTGGGIRGLMSAIMLDRLNAANNNILTNTNLFAGTSTGSAITSLLLAHQTPSQIVNYYQTTVRQFFANQSPSGPTAPGYDVREVFEGQLAIHGGANPILNSFAQKVLFTSFYVGAQDRPWSPVLFHNLPIGNQGTTGIADAVTSSSAMPGMLGSWNSMVDGAFVHHDPTLAAIAVALSNGAALEDIVVLDLGTGFMANWIASDTSVWGAAQWQAGDGNPANQTQPLLVNGSNIPVFNMALNGTSSNLVPMLLQMVLGPRYVNLNPVIPYIPENASDRTSIDTLQNAANNISIVDAVALLGRYWTPQSER